MSKYVVRTPWLTFSTYYFFYEFTEQLSYHEKSFSQTWLLSPKNMTGSRGDHTRTAVLSDIEPNREVFHLSLENSQ